MRPAYISRHCSPKRIGCQTKDNDGVWLSRFTVGANTSMSGFEYPYAFPRRAFMASIAITLGVPPLAALWPGWRGANTNIVEALRSE